ncbi:MAG: hypothetical protein WC799_09545 [Desulfobacteraceae bacterium]
MKREIKMIAAGGVAGILSGSLSGQVNVTGMILGIFLSIGVIVIEKSTTKPLDNGDYPEISRLMITALITGVLSGLLGYFSAGEPLIYLGSFSYPEFVALITLYPLFILPAFFAKYNYLMTVAAGTCTSIIIESFRIFDSMTITITMFDLFLKIIPLILLSAFSKGFIFTFLWFIGVGYTGKRVRW